MKNNYHFHMCFSKSLKPAKLLLVLLLTSIITANAQDTEVGPLANSYIIQNGGGDELVTVGWEGVNIFKYYKAFEKYPIDTLIKILSWNGSGNAYHRDIYVADLNKDDLDEIITAWIDHNMKVKIALLKPDPARMFVDPDNGWGIISLAEKSSPPAYSPNNWFISNDIFVRTANLTTDSTAEFVMAYWAEDGMIEITAYNVGDSLKITEMGSIRDQFITEPSNLSLCEDQTSLFNLQCLDFNGDGIDEILLTGRTNLESGGWEIFANVYSWNKDSGTLEAKAKESLYVQTNANYDIANINSVAGYFQSTTRESAVVSIYQNYLDAYNSGLVDTIANILLPLAMNDQLTNFISGEPIYQRQDTIQSRCFYDHSSTLIACDINNNGSDELISAFACRGRIPTLKIYQGASSQNLVLYADLDSIAEIFQSNIAVGDFYKDTTGDSRKIELIIAIGIDWWGAGEPKMYQINTNPDGSFHNLKIINDYLGYPYEIGGQKKGLMLAGNFDRDIRIGKPKRYSFTEILQPLVILNAPPIHFDIFNGQAYDVCRSYNNNNPEFVAKYIKQVQQMTEVQTEVNRDWSLSGSISTGFSVWGVSVGAHLSQTYGEKFSKVEGSSRTVTVGFGIDAKVDDQIYATVMDYDIWEYPVYGNNKIEGHVLVVDPQIVKNSWFDSKSWKGSTYIPNHEVGNILSYQRYPMLSSNPLMVEKIKGDYGLQTSFQISGNSSYDWFLNFNDFTENQATTTKEFSRDWGVSLSGWGSGVSLDGSYNKEDIQTQRTTVNNDINLSVHLASVDMSIGETRYEVTPYAYWSSNGALVIDYAVSPEISGPGGEDTWWDARYGYLSDPAFILPWRYDPEKGSLISEVKRKQTHDIQFYPQNPADGDTITIRALVSNFSLLPTPLPVGVKFYLGDPDSGGIPIEDIDGKIEIYTPEAIPARGRSEVAIRWKVPPGTPAFPRIFAVIDADNTLMEIHKNNNLGWNILQKTTGSVINYVEEEYLKTDMVAYNFPNPFSGSTQISFRLPWRGNVNISVFNALGQQVATLANGIMDEGLHTVQFDGLNHAPGIYFCAINAGSSQKVIKMVLKK